MAAFDRFLVTVGWEATEEEGVRFMAVLLIVSEQLTLDSDKNLVWNMRRFISEVRHSMTMAKMANF